jgi:tryptophan synthase alpha chain
VDLEDSIRRVRAATSLPVAVGFGISTPQQARSVGRLADGVVVGSALVDILGEDGVGAARSFLGTLRDALDRPAAQ